MGRNFIKIGGFLLFLLAVFWLFLPKNPLYQGIVVPHHLFVSNYIDQLYQIVADEDVERVIVFSPNHFYQGRGGIISSDLDFEKVDVDTEMIESLDADGDLTIDPSVFPLEHGVMVQLPYIQKYFPQAKVVPIIFRPGQVTQEEIAQLVNDIKSYDSVKTFFVASVDFTHYVPEAIAEENDRETVDWFSRWSAGEHEDFSLFELQLLAESAGDNLDAVAFDSPESIYALLKTGFHNFQFVRRSSVNSLIGLDVAANNTSHIFAIFK